jgi:desulfoferrodoxin (superoxide reductase-like protein)
MKIGRIVGIAVLVLFWVTLTTAFANESAVRIEAPESAQPGQEVEILVHVSHSGNNFMHYTELVELEINGELVEKWEYSNFSKPSEEEFTVRYFHAADQDFTISARAVCNMHGSRNTDVVNVTVASDAAPTEAAE